MLHLTNIVKDRIGASHMRFLTLSVEPTDGTEVLRVDCRPGITPAYVTHQNEEPFYVRTGPATSQLPASQIHEYVQHRFHGSERGCLLHSTQRLCISRINSRYLFVDAFLEKRDPE